MEGELLIHSHDNRRVQVAYFFGAMVHFPAKTIVQTQLTLLSCVADT